MTGRIVFLWQSSILQNCQLQTRRGLLVSSLRILPALLYSIDNIVSAGHDYEDLKTLFSLKGVCFQISAHLAHRAKESKNPNKLPVDKYRTVINKGGGD